MNLANWTDRPFICTWRKFFQVMVVDIVTFSDIYNFYTKAPHNNLLIAISLACGLATSPLYFLTTQFFIQRCSHLRIPSVLPYAENTLKSPPLNAAYAGIQLMASSRSARALHIPNK